MRIRCRRGAALLVVTAALCAAPAAAPAADVPPGATWSEATIPSADGVQLHADILRPANLPAAAKTPVILSIGPYFGHSGQTGAVGPAQGTSYDPIGPSTGPSDRFLDLVEGGRLMERGYRSMVDVGLWRLHRRLDWARSAPSPPTSSSPSSGRPRAVVHRLGMSASPTTAYTGDRGRTRAWRGRRPGAPSPTCDRDEYGGRDPPPALGPRGRSRR